jgi:hypothetical protein
MRGEIATARYAYAWEGKMTSKIGCLIAGVVIMSALTMKAEAAGMRFPAAGNFAAEHPRIEEINTRIDNQYERINQGVWNGSITGQQAQQLRANDNAIKQQERTDVKSNGGYLTPAQQKQLNQELNANSALIYDEKHPK